MGIYLDEPLAVMAATAFSAAGVVLGAWWQRRRVAAPPPSPPPSIDSADVLRIETRFERLEALAETTALEIERIAEGQRFTTKLLSERASPSALPTASSDPARPRTPH
jgi:hypothetical protein